MTTTAEQPRTSVEIPDDAARILLAAALWNELADAGEHFVGNVPCAIELDDEGIAAVLAERSAEIAHLDAITSALRAVSAAPTIVAPWAP